MVNVQVFPSAEWVQDGRRGRAPGCNPFATTLRASRRRRRRSRTRRTEPEYGLGESMSPGVPIVNVLLPGGPTARTHWGLIRRHSPRRRGRIGHCRARYQTAETAAGAASANDATARDCAGRDGMCSSDPPLDGLLTATTVPAMPKACAEPPPRRPEPKMRRSAWTRIVDDYSWMRDTSDPRLLPYLRAERGYYDRTTDHLIDLRDELSARWTAAWSRLTSQSVETW